MLRRSGPLMLSLACLASIGFTSTAFALGAGRPVITQKLDETKLTRLTGSLHPAALNPKNDRGIVADNLQLDHMQLLLQRPAEREAELDALIEALHTPGSPQFHQWLTASEFGDRFGLADADIAQVTDWLKLHGFTVNSVAANHIVVDFSGTAAQVREAFHTEIHNVEVNGTKHIANMSAPEVPTALAPAIHGVTSLNNFFPHPLFKTLAKNHVQPGTGSVVKAAAEVGARGARPDYTFTDSGYQYQAVTPKDLETIYNISPIYATGVSGEGQTIAVTEDSDLYSNQDWVTFRNVFGLVKYTLGKLSTTHPGGCTDPGVNGDDAEVIIDAEYASAAAPSASIQVAACASTEVAYGPVLALQNMLNASSKPPAVVSISYGGCESGNGASFNEGVSATYQQAVAEGVSVFASSGDEGAASCDADEAYAIYGIGVSSMAATPYNVAVGGTDFGDSFAGTNADYWNATNTSTFESAKSYIPEIPWNDSCAGALAAEYITGSPAGYGGSGFCNTTLGQEFLTTASGSGGPSTCATGTPTILGYTDGTCAGVPKPSWQKGVVGIPKDKVRDIPDVSLFASNGFWGHYYVVCYSDPAAAPYSAPCTGAPSSWAGFGGTSVSSPIMAGIQTLINQKAGERQGNPNPTLYVLAAREYESNGAPQCNSSLGNKVSSACVFYDVTLGDMAVPCIGNQNCYDPDSGVYGVLSTSDHTPRPAYATGVGYDLATGIGSVNAYNLFTRWSSVTPSSSSK
jgi:subtilase family serine protease